MSRAVKVVLWQVIAAAVFMVVVAVLSLVTGTIGISQKEMPPAYKETRVAVEGRSAFQKAGCTSCHQIMRQGGLGSDLTHVGRKRTERELRALIRDPGRYLSGKEAGLMPTFTQNELSDSQVNTIARYLATLK